MDSRFVDEMVLSAAAILLFLARMLLVHAWLQLLVGYACHCYQSSGLEGYPSLCCRRFLNFQADASLSARSDSAGLYLGEVLSPRHVAGSCVVEATSRLMLEVLPIIAADLLGWKEIHLSNTAGFFRLLGRCFFA